MSPSLYARDVHLYTDYPAPHTLHRRGEMRELQWIFTTKKPQWDPDRYVDIELDCAGPYRFRYTTGSSVGEEEEEGSGFFVVDPTLSYRPDGLCCQTYITKLLGPLSEWRDKLRVAKQTGYNMLHFTPIQQLGRSRSAYSISNQLRMDSSYLPATHTHTDVTVSYTTREGTRQKLVMESSFLEVQKLVKEIHREWGLLSIVDVVWNHTSFDTPWLIQHPEAGYNLVNSPHLRPAYALDVALAQFSRELAEGKWEGHGLRPEVRSEQDVHRLCSVLLETVLPQVRLWEYFCVDVEAVVKVGGVMNVADLSVLVALVCTCLSSCFTVNTLYLTLLLTQVETATFSYLQEFREAVYRLNGGSHPRPEGKVLQVTQDRKYRRLGSWVDTNLTLELFNVDW